MWLACARPLRRHLEVLVEVLRRQLPLLERSKPLLLPPDLEDDVVRQPVPKPAAAVLREPQLLLVVVVVLRALAAVVADVALHKVGKGLVPRLPFLLRGEGVEKG